MATVSGSLHDLSPVERQQRGEKLKTDGIVIRTYDLWKTYIMGDQEIHAVSGVDIQIKRGEYVGTSWVRPARGSPP